MGVAIVRSLRWAAAALLALIVSEGAAFLAPISHNQQVYTPRVSAASTRRRTGSELYMIDNFFRLHEKNRKLNFDELFQKARYDFPQSFGSSAVAFEAGVPVEGKVKQALAQALSQLPASASLDMAVVTVTTGGDESMLDSVLTQLSSSLPGSTRVVGWATPRGNALASSTESAGAFTVSFEAAGGIQITLASLSAVNFFPFFVTEEQVVGWGIDPVAGLWEKLIGLSLNAAYKDPPLFFMFGRVTDPFSLDLAVNGIDAVYPGTAKIGGAVYGAGAEVEQTRLFSRLSSSRDGAAIVVEEQKGVMGLVLAGDIRALVYATQGLERRQEALRYVVEGVSEDGRRIVAVRDEETGQVKAPAELGLSVESDLLLGLGGPEKEVKEEGADRWSFVSVRGAAQKAVRVKAGQWGLVEEDGGGLRLPRVARVGQVLGWLAPGQQGEGELDMSSLVKGLRDEIENDWKKSELGVMRFRPSGVMVVKDSSRPGGLSDDALHQLVEAVPTTYVGGFEAPMQLAPWDPETRSALLEGSMVVNVFACKAKRRDPREVRFDYRRPWLNTGLGSTDNVLDLCFDPLVIDDETGEVVVNRKAALIGTDVRVENMAWNVREERVVATGLLEALVWGKERELQYVREDAPLLNLMRSVMMLVKSTDPEVQAKARGRDVRAAVLASSEWAVVGELSRGSPLEGMVLPVYDPVSLAKGLVEESAAAAIAVHVDQTHYGGKWQDLTDVRDALDRPVIADDLILYPYQTYLAKLFKADGVMLSLQVLTSEDLTYQIKICGSLFITPLLVASSLHQLRQASALLSNTTGAVLVIDNRDPVTMKPRGHVAADWLRDPEVTANLQSAAEEPVVLVQGLGTAVVEGEERAALLKLGVKGQFVPWAGDAFEAAAATIRDRSEARAAAAGGGLPPVGIF